MNKIDIQVSKIFYIVIDNNDMLKDVIRPLLEKLTTYIYVYSKKYK